MVVEQTTCAKAQRQNHARRVTVEAGVAGGRASSEPEGEWEEMTPRRHAGPTFLRLTWKQHSPPGFLLLYRQETEAGRIKSSAQATIW